jgi:hypothetical protein
LSACKLVIKKLVLLLRILITAIQVPVVGQTGFYFKIWKARSLKKIIYKSHNIKLNTINNKFFNYKCIFNNSFFFRTNKNVYKQNLVNLDKLELQPLPSKLIWSICEKKNINI